MIKILNILGARPNYMKVAPLQKLMLADPAINPVLVHTGQHYGDAMSDIFFRQLGLRKPKYALHVGSSTHAQQTAEVMVGFERVINRERPDLVFVVGDVNSTLACSLTAVKMGIPVAHVEAGLRSFDWEMPEEHNRRLTDHISSYLFTSCRDGDANLLNEGIPKKRIHFVGNVMIDSLKMKLAEARESTVRDRIGVTKNGYALMTLHRPSNVDGRKALEHQLDIIRMVQDKLPVVLPLHPRTLKMIQQFRFVRRLDAMKNFIVMPPAGYVDFLKLIMDARVVLSDSGGIQEETTVLKVPCITLRENTERPITITEGTNTLTGIDPVKIEKALMRTLNGKPRKSRIPRFWDGRTAERIVKVIKRELQ